MRQHEQSERANNNVFGVKTGNIYIYIYIYVCVCVYIYINMYVKGKGKVIPLQARCGPEIG